MDTSMIIRIAAGVLIVIIAAVIFQRRRARAK